MIVIYRIARNHGDLFNCIIMYSFFYITYYDFVAIFQYNKD